MVDHNVNALKIRRGVPCQNGEISALAQKGSRRPTEYGRRGIVKASYQHESWNFACEGVAFLKRKRLDRPQPQNSRLHEDKVRFDPGREGLVVNIRDDDLLNLVRACIISVLSRKNGIVHPNARRF